MKMTFNGNDAAEKMLSDLANIPSDVKKDMLEKGSQVVVKAHKESIISVGLVKTGAMRDSIAPGKYQNTDDGGEIDVYPHGKDENGTRNAEKGYINEYGSSRHEAKHWMQSANDKCEDAAVDAMAEVYGKYQDTI